MRKATTVRSSCTATENSFHLQQLEKKNRGRLSTTKNQLQRNCLQWFQWERVVVWVREWGLTVEGMDWDPFGVE